MTPGALQPSASRHRCIAGPLEGVRRPSSGLGAADEHAGRGRGAPPSSASASQAAAGVGGRSVGRRPGRMPRRPPCTTDRAPQPCLTAAGCPNARATYGRGHGAPTAPTAPTTLGELRASGHAHRPVKAEIRDNLLARLRAGEPRFPGIVGFDETVLPAARARPARRPRPRPARRARPGQDPADPHPRRPARRVDAGRRRLRDQRPPATRRSARAAGGCVAELGDDLPVGWQHRSERYGEKLATPDTSVGDLIGDVDPIKVAEGRTLGDPETVHYGLVPRTNRGIFAINELPDLAERIQVVAAQRAGGARHPGPRLRAAAAARPAARRQRQPRGLHQPRPHHHAAQGPLRRRGPHPLPARARRRDRPDPPGGRSAGAGAASTPRARPPARGRRPVHPARARVARGRPALRASRPGSPSRRPRRSPRRRVRRAALTGETPPVARVVRPAVVVAGLRGKVEFEAERGGPRGRGPRAPAAPGDRRDVPARSAALDLTGLHASASTRALTVETGELVPAPRCSTQVGPLPGLARDAGAARRRRGARLRGWPRPRWSSRSRGCT